MRRTPHPSHHFHEFYCTFCGTLDRALDGSVEAPCVIAAKQPATPPQPQDGIDWFDLIKGCSA